MIRPTHSPNLRFMVLKFSSRYSSHWASSRLRTMMFATMPMMEKINTRVMKPATSGAARFQNGFASIGHHLSPIHWNAIEPNQPERFTAKTTPSKVTSALIPPLK